MVWMLVKAHHFQVSAVIHDGVVRFAWFDGTSLRRHHAVAPNVEPRNRPDTNFSVVGTANEPSHSFSLPSQIPGNKDFALPLGLGFFFSSFVGFSYWERRLRAGERKTAYIYPLSCDCFCVIVWDLQC
jgi:hypothetical protein